ncbi:Response regulator [Verrucomicrobia bacterium]|nr:Response regulator [Verrucomicrobiota bacterium]
MRNPLKILVAEDDSGDALLLERAFAKAMIRGPVYFVGDGEQVVDYLQGNRPFDNPVQHPLPDILLLDLRMPRMDGFAVLEWLRTQPRLRHIRVVVFSASDRREDMELAASLGAKGYLVKPHRPEQLAGMVKTLEDDWLRIGETEHEQTGSRSQAAFSAG